MNYLLNKGVAFVVIILITVGVLVLIGGGVYLYLKNNSISLNQENNNSVSQNQSPVILPTGYVGTRYSVLLTIRGVTRENLGTVVDQKNLPPGISLELIELPCAPQASQCLPQPYLIGTPTSSGNYQFAITTSFMKVSYSLQIK